MSWCPVKDNSLLKSGFSAEIFLATSGRDKNLKIWEAFGGKCVAQSKLPGNTGVHRGRPGMDDKRWTALHWLNENIILSGGLGGELLSWEVYAKVHLVHNLFFNLSF